MKSSLSTGKCVRTRPGKGFLGVILALAVVASLMLSGPVAAVEKDWAVGDGDWNLPNNWNPAGQPQGGDDVYLVTNSYGTSYTINYFNSAYPSAILNTLYIDAQAVKSSVTLNQGYYGTYQDLASKNEYVGYNGVGVHNQSAGSNTLSQGLLVADNPNSIGYYNLSGSGSLSSSFQYIGVKGNGTFSQTGGSNTVSDVIYVGGLPGGSGTYTQSGGLTQITNNLYLGFMPANPAPSIAAANGTYNLSDTGGLVASYEYVGYSGIGNFSQTGGTNTVTSHLFVGYNPVGSGTYTQSAGMSQITGNLYLGSNPVIPIAPWIDTTNGTYNLGGSGSLSATNEYVGYFGGGTFNQTGGINIVNQDLHLGDQPSSNGTYTHSAGTNQITGSLYLGYSPGLPEGNIPSARGTYNLSDTGSLSATNEYVGYAGTNCYFSQTGGTNTVGSAIWLGYYQGANGIYNQTGGSTNATNGIIIGVFPGASGTYYLRGGSLTAGLYQYMGYSGTGTFNQTGGTNTVTGSSGTIYVALNPNSVGTYNLYDPGSLSAPYQYIGYSGTGTFNQGGGTNVVSKTLTIAANSGSSGTYNLQGGSLSAGTVDLKPGGLFNQTYGTLDAAYFHQEGGTVQGILENRGVFTYDTGIFSGRLLNGGTVVLNNDFTAGNGLAHYSATPITIDTGRVLTLNGAGLEVDQGSTFNQLGGSISATWLTIANVGGIFAQAGGTTTVTGPLTVTTSAAGNGFYNLLDGTLTVGQQSAATTMCVGQSGPGDFSLGFDPLTQKVGGSPTFTLYGDLKVGDRAGSAADVFQYGGTAEVKGSIFLGISGPDTTDPNHTIPAAAADYMLVDGALTVGQAGSLSSTVVVGGGGFADLFLGVDVDPNKTHAPSFTLNGNLIVGDQGSSSGLLLQRSGQAVVRGDLILGNQGPLPGRDPAIGIYNLSGSNLSASNQLIGNSGIGVFNQDGGNNTVSNAIFLGLNSGSSGSYHLSGTDSQLSASIQFIGYSGTGTFTQSGGTNTAPNGILFGVLSGASGSYSLSGGTLAAPLQDIGFNGTGTFTQSGGTNTVNDFIVLGVYSGASGAYNLSGGSLWANQEYIGHGGTGIFAQAGGTNTVKDTLTVAAIASGNGYYNLLDGTLIVGQQSAPTTLYVGKSGPGNLFLGYDPFTGQVIGSPTLTLYGDLKVGDRAGSSATVFQYSGTAEVKGSILLGIAGPDTSDPNNTIHAASATYQLVDGALTVGQAGSLSSTVVVGAGGFADFLMGVGVDPTKTHAPNFTLNGNLMVGDQASSSGLVVQRGGQAVVKGDIILGNQGPLPGLDPAYGEAILDSGSLSSSNQYIGYSGIGNFSQTGGSNTVTNEMYLGFNASSSGAYYLGGTDSQLSATKQYIGYSGNGAFNQIGGTNTVGDQWIGYMGTGTYNHSAGTNNVTNGISLGLSSTGSGTYSLSGTGSLSAPFQAVGYTGPGFFNQTGGTNNCSGEIYVGDAPTGTGTYTLKDGTLKAQNLIVGWFGTANFNQTGDSSQSGGTVVVNNDLNIGIDPQGNGTYTMDKGTLTTKDLIVGSPGNGSVTGTLNITNAQAQVSVGGNFTINTRGQFIAAPGVTINMTGANFYDYNPNDDLHNVSLIFSNPMASDFLGFAGTFILGTVDLTSGAQVTLKDLLASPNVAAAFYVGDILGLKLQGNEITNIIGAPGLTMYYDPNLNPDLNGNYNLTGGGTLAEGTVPLPASAWLLLTGLTGLGLLRRRKQGKTS